MSLLKTRLLRITLFPGLAWLLLAGLALAAGPLPNGVAAGDVTQTTAVLWVRATVTGPVLFAYSTDPALVTDVLTATAAVTSVTAPVKVTLTGLSPATLYAYRATDAAGASGQGRFRTAAQAGSYAGLRFGVSGDWGGHLAPYPAISNAPGRNLAFFVEHGDTAYADVASPALHEPAVSLADFRLKHDEGYGTHLGLNSWADLRSATAIMATIDDHEVRNDFAGGAPPSTDARFDNTGSYINETALYQNGLQAFQEYNPLRDEFYGATGDPRTAARRRLYRFNTYGRDAAVFVLDTRSFRDKQLPLSSSPTYLQVVQFLSDSLADTSRTMLGTQQLADLKAGLLQAQAAGVTWKFILTSGPIQNLGVFGAPDRWEGYAAERANLLRFIKQNGIANVVFVAASLHGTLVNNLTYQEAVAGPQIPTGAFEIITGPVATYPPFGPATIALARSYGLLTPAEEADYLGRDRAGKDEFVHRFVDEKLLAPLGYEPIGLDGSGLNATLLQGGYVAVHTYGWTEFEIGQAGQVLKVTTYGIDSYSPTDLVSNPAGVIGRTPAIVSQFVVTPTLAGPPPFSHTYLPLLLKN